MRETYQRTLLNTVVERSNMEPGWKGGGPLLREGKLKARMTGVGEADGLRANVLELNRSKVHLLRAETGLRQQHVVEEILTSDYRLVGAHEELLVHTTRLIEMKELRPSVLPAAPSKDDF